MPGTPATTPIHGAPRAANTDTFDIARDVNGLADRFDITAMRLDTGLASARPPAAIAGRWYYATDTKALSRDTGSAWELPAPSAHAASHQDGGTDALTVREAMMATGNVGLAKGAFSAYRNAAQSVATGAVISFDTEEFDVSNWHDVTTNVGRYTPQVPGYYALFWEVTVGGSLAADVAWRGDLRKNGAIIRRGTNEFQRLGGTSGQVDMTSFGSTVIQANGSTDFFDVIVTHIAGAAQPVRVGPTATCWSGHLVGRS